MHACQSGTTQNYWYDPTGNLDCITLSSGTQANCAPGAGGSYSAQVLADYTYDYLDRLTQYRSFVTNGTTSTKDDASDYEYDALDRVVEQTESHGATGSPRTTLLTYVGLGAQVSAETHHNGDDGTDPLLTAKSYSYDAFGHRIGLTNAPTGGTAASFTYGYDVHGSVSLLLNSTGTATASYGYRSYGAADPELTKGDVNADNPLNAYRYSAKRLDSGSGSIDMGARRFGPDTARFLQRDAYNGATSDLGLGLDPLTQNRYALASGNPISYVESDGHAVFKNGGGGGGMAGGSGVGFIDDVAAGIAGLVQGAGRTLELASTAARNWFDDRAAAVARTADRVAQGAAWLRMRLSVPGARAAGALAQGVALGVGGIANAVADTGARVSSAIRTAGEAATKWGFRAGVVTSVISGGIQFFSQWESDANRSDLGMIGDFEAERAARAVAAGGAVAGGALIGGAVGLLCGPAAVLCVPAGAVAGGLIGEAIAPHAAEWTSSAIDAGAGVGDWAAQLELFGG